ncbi:pyridoxal-phosphate dependent enzyme [Embleya sp. NPDC020886]|uniref:pyridoxal-phosphate dependent enzyme n=1 Tax=Embleya sp. NPDC020886 TaxID=3363980 RepID=UPI0037B2BE1C
MTLAAPRPRPRPVRVPETADLDRAWEVVREVLAPTPVFEAGPGLGGGLLKLETTQPTGSFKVRGALSALAALPPGTPAVTASAGNHGLAMAWAAQRIGAEATVVVSTRASAAKVDRIAAYPVGLVRHGDGFDDAEAHALGLPGHYVSAYNDPAVIAGQATIGRELDAQTVGPLTVVVPVGGGGLAAGLSLWARARGDVRVVGVESAASLAVSHAVRVGRVARIEIGETIADGVRGGIEPGCVTPEILAGQAELTCATEDELRAAMRWLYREHGLVAEGAGALAVAAVLAGKVTVTGRLVVALTGRNVTVPTYLEAIGHD